MKPKGIEDKESQKISAQTSPSNKNFDKQGQQGNTKINTTNQGYQQDR